MGSPGRGRDLVDQVAEVQRAAHIVQDARASQGVDGSDDVDRLALGEERAKGLVDLSVRLAVEVVGLEDLHDVGHRLGGQQHGTEDRALGIEVLGRYPVAGDLDDLVSDAHHADPPLDRHEPDDRRYASHPPADSGERVWIAAPQVGIGSLLSLPA